MRIQAIVRCGCPALLSSAVLLSCTAPTSPDEGQPAPRPELREPQVDEHVGARVLAVALTSPELLAYLHPEQPGRVPLVVVTDPHLVAYEPVLAFGAPVVFVSPDSERPSASPYLEVSALVLDDGQAQISLRYPLEGIHGVITLARHDTGWRLLSTSIFET